MNRKQAKKCIQLSCGEGWLFLVDEVFDALPLGCRVDDIYQKYGSLHVDIKPENLEFEKLLYDIECRSEFICEICGDKGSHYVIDGSLEAARCLKHCENGIDLHRLPKS